MVKVKISTLVFVLIIILVICLTVVASQENLNVQIIETLSDVLKVSVGALAGAIVGEKEKNDE